MTATHTSPWFVDWLVSAAFVTGVFAAPMSAVLLAMSPMVPGIVRVLGFPGVSALVMFIGLVVAVSAGRFSIGAQPLAGSITAAVVAAVAFGAGTLQLTSGLDRQMQISVGAAILALAVAVVLAGGGLFAWANRDGRAHVVGGVSLLLLAVAVSVGASWYESELVDAWWSGTWTGPFGEAIEQFGISDGGVGPGISSSPPGLLVALPSGLGAATVLVAIDRVRRRRQVERARSDATSN